MIYDSIPSQLALHKKRFFITSATSNRYKNKNNQLLSEIIDSKTVIICYNTADPSVSLSQTKKLMIINYIYLMLVYLLQCYSMIKIIIMKIFIKNY